MEAARPEPSGDESGEGGGMGEQDMALEEGVLEASYSEARVVEASYTDASHTEASQDGRDGFYSLQVYTRLSPYCYNSSCLLA